jgi:hypothetical protein
MQNRYFKQKIRRVLNRGEAIEEFSLKATERGFGGDFDRNGIGGSSAIFLNNLERIQELPEHPL